MREHPVWTFIGFLFCLPFYLLVIPFLPFYWIYKAHERRKIVRQQTRVYIPEAWYWY